jgi:YfiH family protein
MPAVASGVVEPAASGGRPARWAATGRFGGESRAPYDSLNLAGYVGDDPAAVAANRARVAQELGLPADAIVLMDSVHGAELAEVSGPGVVAGVDALLTHVPGLAIVALGADCVPMAILGADGRTICAVHCGWRGLVADVVGVAVSAVRASATEVGAVVLGPAVCGACYPVPPSRAREVAGSTSPAVSAAALVRTLDGQPGIDVRAGVHARLLDLGVAATAITWAGGCTVEDPGLFSFRRDGITGRQGMAVCLVPGAPFVSPPNSTGR